MRTISVHNPSSPEFLHSAVFGLLSKDGHSQPLLVVIDDAHRLDAHSTAALGRAAAHLGGKAAALLCAVGDNGVARTLPGTIRELCLKGLDRESTRRLLVWLWGAEPDPTVLDQLVVETGGNPLALRELVNLLRKTQLAGEEPLSSPLPVSGHIGHAFLRAVRDLPDRTQTALVVAAAAGLESTARIAMALHLLEPDNDDPRHLERLVLEPAEQAGIVERDANRVGFRHPIVRSAVYHRASAGGRRGAHLALARALALLPDPQAADRRVWHQAAATASSPRSSAGAAVEAAALQAYSLGQYTAGGRGLELAASLSTQADHRARCLLRAATGWYLSGSGEQADQLLDLALTDAKDPWLRADLMRFRGWLWTWTGKSAGAYSLLEGLAARADALDDAHSSASLCVDAGLAALLAGDGQLASRAAKRAEQLAAPLGSATLRTVSLGVSPITLVSGRAVGAYPLTDRQPCADEVAALGDQWAPLAAQTLIWLERYETAEQALDQVVEHARARNAPALLPVPLALLAETAFRTGRWEDARRLATEAVNAGERVGQPHGRALGFGCLARLYAARGLELQCRSQATAVVEHAPEGSWSRAQAAAALGLLALGIGETHEAVCHLKAAATMLTAHGFHDASVVQWAPDLIEAYLRAGRVADARRLLDRFETQAERTERTWALAVTARCRGLLASEEEFEYHFAAAFRWHDRTQTPFERVRTALCLGTRLRRAGRLREARVHLHAALGVLEQLDATPWAQRARAELRMTGDQADVVRWAERRLSPKEVEVAWLVAQGRTNREIANVLGITPRTVAFHLGNIYRKLDLRSRADLEAAGPSSRLAG
jgi:DNA-binding CsgD family transcriptional regulator